MSVSTVWVYAAVVGLLNLSEPAEPPAPGVARRARQPFGSRAGPGKHVAPVRVAASHYAVRQPVGLTTVVSTWVVVNVRGLPKGWNYCFVSSVTEAD